MKTKSFKSGIKLLVALTMVPASFVPEISYAKAAAAACSAKKTCSDEVKKVTAQDAATGLSAGTATPGQSNQGQRMNNAGTAGAAVACAAQGVCEKSKEKASSDKTCKDNDKQEIDSMLAQVTAACSTNTGAAAGGAATQSAASSGGGGGDMSGLMGAAMMGGLMAMMMMKKKQEEEAAAAAALAAQQAQMYNGALQANGTIDCSKPDALAYRDCNLQMENRCKSILDDPTCQQFSSRYCGPTSGSPAQITVQPQTPPGVILGVNPATLYGAVGEGMGTQFCRGVTGWNYCKTGGREQCPSCLQIQRNQSAACAQNPALCMAQNSVAEIEKAKSTCPTDPAFADPTFTAGGGAQVPPALGAPGSLPAVVLPQSVGSTVSTGSNVAGTTQTGGGISTQSATVAAGTNPNEQGLREGYANGNSQASYGGGGGSASTGAFAAGAAGGREFASAGGMRPASAGVSGPATDVEGQYGPSLFTTSSQVIRRRCQAGRLNNCP